MNVIQFTKLFIKRLLNDKVDFGMLLFITIIGVLGVTTDKNLTWTVLGFAGYVAWLIFRYQGFKELSNPNKK